MSSFSILSLLLFSPIIGAMLLILFVDRNSFKSVYNTGLLISFIPLIVALVLLVKFDLNIHSDFQFIELLSFSNESLLNYHLGVDGISLLFVLLTVILIPICIVIGKNSIKNIFTYIVALLFTEAMVVGAFISLDILLFYIFFEAILIPMYILIGIWGSGNRIYASYKLFLYTLAGSLPFLLAIIYIYINYGTTDYLQILNIADNIELDVKKILWVCMFISFAVKIPMWPVHTWLPDVHVQAPTGGSVLLAGILIKLGGYAMLRYLIPIFPDVSKLYAEAVIILGIIAIIYTSLVALVQDDMKKMIAYSSVAHMGYVTIGLFSGNYYGFSGAVIQMISHGLISAALFICVGFLYDQCKTKKIDQYGGVMSIAPKFSFFVLFFVMASIGLPSTSGFIGEFSVILGLFQYNSLYAILASLGVVLGAGYMLYLYSRVILGQVNNNLVIKIKDINFDLSLIFFILVVFIILIGMYPNIINIYIADTINNLLEIQK